MNLYNETRDILKKYNITANKKLGQNFLIDDEAIENIIESSNVNKEDLVIAFSLRGKTKEILEEYIEKELV